MPAGIMADYFVLAATPAVRSTGKEPGVVRSHGKGCIMAEGNKVPSPAAQIRRSGNLRMIIGTAAASIVVVAVTVYVFTALIRINSGEQTQNAIGMQTLIHP
jgi:hypothetical protein